MKTLIKEHIRPITQTHRDTFYNLDEVFTIEEVIDTENLTKWVFTELNKLKEQPNSNIQNYQLTLKEEANYRTEHGYEREKITNVIVITWPGQKYVWEKSKLIFICRDGEIIIKLEGQLYDVWSDVSTEDSWLYDDLNKQDAKDIAHFIFDKLNENKSPEAKKVRSIRLKDNRGLNTEFSTFVNTVKSAIEEAGYSLPRGKARIQLSSDNRSSSLDSVVYTLVLSYRQNSGAPYRKVCSFTIINNGDGTCNVVCSDTNDNSLMDDDFEILSEDSKTKLYAFVKVGVFDSFDLVF